MFEVNINTLLFCNAIFFTAFYIKPALSFCKSLAIKCSKWNQLTKMVSMKYENKVIFSFHVPFPHFLTSMLPRKDFRRKTA